MTYDLEKLLPHKPPMIFLSGVSSIDFDKGELVAWFEVKESDVGYCPKMKGVPGYAALEYMAQAVGCFVGAHDLKEDPNGVPGAGFVLGTRSLDVHTEVFGLSQRYFVRVSALFCDESIASFDCVVYNDKQETLATALLNAYRPESMADFMKEYA